VMSNMFKIIILFLCLAAAALAAPHPQEMAMAVVQQAVEFLGMARRYGVPSAHAHEDNPLKFDEEAEDQDAPLLT